MEFKKYLENTLSSVMAEGEKFTHALVLRENDLLKFKHPEDAQLLFQMLMLLGYGMASQLESNIDYDSMMTQLESILKMLKQNFYKEEYLL